MKRFLKNVAVFAGISVFLVSLIVAFDLFVVGNQYTHSYSAALGDKIERLQSITEPKIILVGNSNLSFGIDSAAIEQAMNMPVVNLGYHGGMGNAFHEEMAKLGIRQGDIVVVCHTEYDADEIEDAVLLCSTLEKDTKLWQLLRPKDWKMFLKGYPRYCINAAIRYFMNGDQPMADNSYARSAFNEYGDIVVRPEVAEDARIFFEGALTVPVITAEEMERMNSFNRYVREQGATMVVTFYAVAMGEYTPAEEEYLQFQSELAQKLDCEIISDIRDYFMPYAYFYDTVYHLTDEGTAIRTGQLIEDLQNWLQKPPSQTISP